jgi:hypothetical protein
MIPKTTNRGLHDFVGYNVLNAFGRSRLNAAAISGESGFILPSEEKK